MPTLLRDYLVTWALVILVFAVVGAVRADPVWSEPGRAALTLVISGVAAGIVLVRRRVRRAAVEWGGRRRAERGLPPVEERSFREDLREHPVRTIGLLALLVGGVAVLAWLRLAR